MASSTLVWNKSTRAVDLALIQLALYRLSTRPLSREERRRSLMPLASEAKAPTYSWIQRSSQLTEFAMLKDSVKKLERVSREQLLLENESQGAFDFLSGEVQTLKEAVGALSQVVDGELQSLRDELRELREEVKQSVRAARSEADAAAQNVADSQRSAQALVELSVAQLKENVGRVENELRDARTQHLDLASQHSSAVARLEAGTENVRAATSQRLETLVERVAQSEALGGSIREELDQKLRHEHAGLMKWSDEARGQLRALRADVDGARGVADGATRRAEELEAAQRATSEAMQEAAAEGRSHANAIRLLVENVEAGSAEAEQARAKLGEKVQGLETSMAQRGAEHASLARAVEAETKRQRDAVKQLEGTCVALRDEAGSAKSAIGRHADRLKSLEGDLMALKRESAEGTAQQRALKAQIKEVGDGLAAHKKEVRRAGDQTEMRYEAYDEACAAFAQALKIANPVAAALSSAAAAL